MKRKKRRCLWFIEPEHPDTNKYVSKELAENKYVNERPNVPCFDGALRVFWAATSLRFVDQLAKAGEAANLPFKLWRQIGNEPAKPWLFSLGTAKKWLRVKRRRKQSYPQVGLVS